MLCVGMECRDKRDGYDVERPNQERKKFVECDSVVNIIKAEFN